MAWEPTGGRVSGPGMPKYSNLQAFRMFPAIRLLRQTLIFERVFQSGLLDDLFKYLQPVENTLLRNAA